MKIVFCGPPHSGKSVFIANIIDKMPTDAHTIIRACPDGEGNWSNNKNQTETSMVRKKGKFTKTFIDDACTAIDNQTNEIVLVDVGGVMSSENEKVFKHCDSFIVLSNDEQKKKDWLKFGQELGLKCIGCLDSSLEGKEEIYKREPYLQGKISGLERGEILEDSQVISGIVSDIIKKSKYAEKENENQTYDGVMIDDTEFGFELGCGKEIQTEAGTNIKKVKWTEESIPKVYSAIRDKVHANDSVKIYGIRANFILSAICKACKNLGVKDISTYDIRLKQYFPIRNIPQKRGINQTTGLKFNIIENKENTFLDVDITNEQFSLEDYQNCVIPKIKKDKNLYLSGRMPLWLLASISTSYDAKRIFTFQPGKGFTCISSLDEKDLGTVVDGVDGINLKQYFEDKRKEANNEKHPIVAEKQTFLAKIKEKINNIKDNRRKQAKYLDENIVATRILPNTDNNSSKTDKFQHNIQQEIAPTKEITKNKESNPKTKDIEL